LRWTARRLQSALRQEKYHDLILRSIANITNTNLEFSFGKNGFICNYRTDESPDGELDMDWDLGRTVTWLVLGLMVWPSFICLGFLLFRLKPKYFIPQISICSIILISLSTFLQMKNYGPLTSVAQPICLVLCYWLICRIQIVYSLLMVILTYALNIILEDLINLGLTSFNYNNFIQIMRTDLYLSTSLIVLINIGTCYLLNKYRIGFSFIKLNRLEPVRIPRKVYFLFILGLLFITACSLSLFNLERFYLFFVLFSFLFMLLLFRFSWRKESSD
jgi:hypothetical protein